MQAILLKYLVVALVVLGGVYFIYHKGEEHVQAKWDIEKARVEAEIKDLKEKAGKVTTVVEIKYVDRIKTVTVKGDTITQYVDRYITAEADKNCTIPNNFILLHDSAVKNIVPEGAAK